MSSIFLDSGGSWRQLSPGCSTGFALQRRRNGIFPAAGKDVYASPAPLRIAVDRHRTAIFRRGRNPPAKRRIQAMSQRWIDP
jgi:hypothetical protein